MTRASTAWIFHEYHLNTLYSSFVFILEDVDLSQWYIKGGNSVVYAESFFVVVSNFEHKQIMPPNWKIINLFGTIGIFYWQIEKKTLIRRKCFISGIM